MEWFKNVFLPSLVEREMEQRAGKQQKYNGQLILTVKQADICRRYMGERQCHGDYGCFNIFDFATDSHKFQLTEQGKYTFLHISPIKR